MIYKYISKSFNRWHEINNPKEATQQVTKHQQQQQ